STRRATAPLSSCPHRARGTTTRCRRPPTCAATTTACARRGWRARARDRRRAHRAAPRSTAARRSWRTRTASARPRARGGARARAPRRRRRRAPPRWRERRRCGTRCRPPRRAPRPRRGRAAVRATNRSSGLHLSQHRRSREVAQRERDRVGGVDRAQRLVDAEQALHHTLDLVLAGAAPPRDGLLHLVGPVLRDRAAGVHCLGYFVS